MGLLGQGKASWKTLRALSCTIRTALQEGSGHLKLWLALRIWPRLFAGNPGFEDNSGEKMDLRTTFNNGSSKSTIGSSSTRATVGCFVWFQIASARSMLEGKTV